MIPPVILGTGKEMLSLTDTWLGRLAWLLAVAASAPSSDTPDAWKLAVSETGANAA